MTNKSVIWMILSLLCACDFLAAAKGDGKWYPKNVDQMFERLEGCKDCKSLLKRHLTKDVFNKLKDITTPGGATLGDCILSGVLHLDSNGGVYAADQASYTVFSLLFDPVIKELHEVKNIAQPGKDYGDPKDLVNIDPAKKFVVHTSIGTIRSHTGIAYPPIPTNEDRVRMEKMTVPVLERLENDLKGSYSMVAEMEAELDEKKKRAIFEGGRFFTDPDDSLIDTEILRKDWPSGRGIYTNNAKTFDVVVNDAEHLKIISSELGGDFHSVYSRLIRGLNYMEKHLDFARDKRLGFLAFFPINIGTGLRVTVRVRLPYLSSNNFPQQHQSRLVPYNLQAKAVPENPGVFDISNTRVLGMTKIAIVTQVANGVLELVNIETEMEKR